MWQPPPSWTSPLRGISCRKTQKGTPNPEVPSVVLCRFLSYSVALYRIVYSLGGCAPMSQVTK